MKLEVNTAPPEVMHIDLNSAFAMTEQQANPLLRGRPVGVTNRLNDYAICIAASYEAKQLGVKLGTRNRDARLRAPNFVMLETDPAKYQHVHRQLKSIFKSYSPTAYMKSIDEGIIDFRDMQPVLTGRPLEDIGSEIKLRIRQEIGDYMTVNVGIGQNLWLAKLAAGFMKPDGLYTIDANNLEAIYSLLRLTELPYIASRMKIRLNNVGIYTPYELFCASERVLTKQVFKSVNGHHWYLKLRGYETEIQTGIRSAGRSYVLEHRTADPEELAALWYKSAVKIARRLGRNELAARGLLLYLTYKEPPYRWHQRRMHHEAVRRGDQLYRWALELFGDSPKGVEVSAMAMTAYAVEPYRADQLHLYEDQGAKQERLEDALNKLNDRYGELSVLPAGAWASRNPMKDKISFGTIRYFD
jgi:DNA polymerase-4